MFEICVNKLKIACVVNIIKFQYHDTMKNII